jgi:hypothetical protein
MMSRELPNEPARPESKAASLAFLKYSEKAFKIDLWSGLSHRQLGRSALH